MKLLRIFNEESILYITAEMNTLIYALFPYNLCQQPRLVFIFYCCAHCFYEAEITTHVSNHVTLEGFIFFKMHFDNLCTGKEYPKDETKQTKIQANVIWKPSIIVERFSVSYNCCIIANHCYCSRPCSDSMDIRKRDDFFFLEKLRNMTTSC